MSDRCNFLFTDISDISFSTEKDGIYLPFRKEKLDYKTRKMAIVKKCLMSFCM